MKKLLFTILASMALLSCGDDGSGSVSGPKPVSATIADDIAMTFAYDDKDRIQSVSAGGTTTTFTYNAESLVDKVITGDDFYQFTYDDDGKYTGIVNPNGDVGVLTHLGDDNYSSDGLVVNLESNGDWEEYQQFEFSYSNRKGAFAHVKSFNVLALLLIDFETLYFASRKRRSAITSGNTVSSYTAVEGEKGLPASETVEGVTIQYVYSE